MRGENAHNENIWYIGVPTLRHLWLLSVIIVARSKVSETRDVARVMSSRGERFWKTPGTPHRVSMSVCQEGNKTSRRVRGGSTTDVNRGWGVTLVDPGGTKPHYLERRWDTLRRFRLDEDRGRGPRGVFSRGCQNGRLGDRTPGTTRCLVKVCLWCDRRGTITGGVDGRRSRWKSVLGYVLLRRASVCTQTGNSNLGSSTGLILPPL